MSDLPVLPASNDKPETTLANVIAGVFNAVGGAYGTSKGFKPVNSANDVGERVREARKAMGLSQQAFADLAGVGRRFVSELEGGKATLEFERVLKVCQAAGIVVFTSPRSAIVQRTP